MLSGYLESFTRLVREETPDGLGGQDVVWVPGERVCLAVVPARPGLTGSGGAPALRRRITLIAPEDIPLRLGERLRRTRTNEVLRVLGDPAAYHTPSGARVGFGEAEAEVVPE